MPSSGLIACVGKEVYGYVYVLHAEVLRWKFGFVIAFHSLSHDDAACSSYTDSKAT